MVAFQSHPWQQQLHGQHTCNARAKPINCMAAPEPCPFLSSIFNPPQAAGSDVALATQPRDSHQFPIWFYFTICSIFYRPTAAAVAHYGFLHTKPTAFCNGRSWLHATPASSHHHQPATALLHTHTHPGCGSSGDSPASKPPIFGKEPAPHIVG